MSDHFEPKLYFAVGRAGGKVYESQRLMYDLLVNGYKLEPMDVKKENNMNDIEFTNLHVKNILNGVIGAKPPKQPVMSKPIQHMAVQEPEIVLKSSWDGDDVNGVMATFRKDIYAKVADTTDKAIVDAIIDFARSEGFTDAYLIDKTYIMAALDSKLLQEELERALDDAEERNNVKDHHIDELRNANEHQKKQIETQAATISQLRRHLKEYDDRNTQLKNELNRHNNFNFKLDANNEKLKAENDDLKKKLTDKFAECKNLGQRINDLDTLMGNKNERIRADHEKIADLNRTIRETREHMNKLYDDIHDIATERDTVKAENAELNKKIDEMENLIGRYEVMKQTLEMVFGDVINI